MATEMTKAKTSETAKPIRTSRSVGSVLSHSDAWSAQPDSATLDGGGRTALPIPLRRE